MFGLVSVSHVLLLILCSVNASDAFLKLNNSTKQTCFLQCTEFQISRLSCCINVRFAFSDSQWLHTLSVCRGGVWVRRNVHAALHIKGQGRWEFLLVCVSLCVCMCACACVELHMVSQPAATRWFRGHGQHDVHCLWPFSIAAVNLTLQLCVCLGGCVALMRREGRASGIKYVHLSCSCHY